jgi:hypothetical protein
VIDVAMQQICKIQTNGNVLFTKSLNLIFIIYSLKIDFSFSLVICLIVLIHPSLHMKYTFY